MPLARKLADSKARPNRRKVKKKPFGFLVRAAHALCRILAGPVLAGRRRAAGLFRRPAGAPALGERLRERLTRDGLIAMVAYGRGMARTTRSMALPAIVVGAAALTLSYAPELRSSLDSFIAGTSYEAQESAPEASGSGESPDAAPSAQEPSAEQTPQDQILEGEVQRGESASMLLNDCLSMSEIHSLSLICRPVFPLTALRAGQPYSLSTADGLFQRFVYEIDTEEKLVVTREDEGFAAKREPIQYDIALDRVKTDIASSLYEAVASAGEQPGLAIALADIFGWEIDFVRDLRPGDSFSALVEKRYRGGQFVGYGNVLMAEFTNQGTLHEAFRYESQGHADYFDGDANSLRRMFLKVPLDFRRISSGYTMARLHPLLNVLRPHQGIDYAAPVGTPVRAVADGTVLFAGRGGGEGNYIRLQHVGSYETTYMHLSGFARGVKSRAQVSQGQVIGFVGSTGLSTGPHLDFRIKLAGKFINPAGMDNRRAPGLAKNQLDSFQTTVAEYRSALNRLAAADGSGKPKM